MSGILPDVVRCNVRIDCLLPDGHQGRCEEWRWPPSASDGKAGGPSVAGAGGGTHSTEPRRTLHGPAVEAAGDAQRYYRAERAAVIRLAEVWHGIGTGKYPVPGPLDDAIRAAIALVPIVTCRGCGTEYVQGDGRRRFYCSVRCQQRQSKREQRARLKAAQAAAEAKP